MKPHPELIEKFLSNQCTHAEAEIVIDYFKKYPGIIEQYIPLNNLLDNNYRKLDTVTSERILQRIRETYNEEKSINLSKIFLRYAVAASVAGIMIMASIIFLMRTGNQISRKTITKIKGIDSIQSLKIIENKSIIEIQTSLPDGSVVTIYPGSSLQYLPAFEKKRRDLYLKGKALFQVSKDALKPFTVYASGIATTALGTKFLVSELVNQKVSIVLIEGIVKVRPQYAAEDDKIVIMHPGDELLVGRGQFNNYALTLSRDKKRKNAVAKSDKIQSNEEAMFIFKNQSMNEVFQQIEKQFGITITCEDNTGIEEKLFTGTFLKNDSLEFICKTICEMHGLRYEIDGKTVTITSQ